MENCSELQTLADCSNLSRRYLIWQSLSPERLLSYPVEAVQAGRQPGGEVGRAELAAEGEPGPGSAPIPAPPAGQYSVTIVILNADKLL